MIIRIFRVRVPENLTQEFEEKFISISVPYVQASSGLISVTIGKAITENSQDYLMISQWESVESIEQFVGENWQQAVIPSGMEKYIQECGVEHFEELV